MARLIMLSNVKNNATPLTVVHPRSGRAIRKFSLRKIICWNDTGVLGGSMKLPIWNLDESMGAYGVLELYDEYAVTGNTDPVTAANLVMRIPVSAKSRLSLELPGKGLVFKRGVRVKLGTESSTNSSKKMHFQLVGYEYSINRV